MTLALSIISTIALAFMIFTFIITAIANQKENNNVSKLAITISSGLIFVLATIWVLYAY